jgi:hypothetical protein
LRGNGVSILASIASDQRIEGYKHVLPVLDRVAALVDDMWPVQSQLTLLASSLLQTLPPDQSAVIARVCHSHLMSYPIIVTPLLTSHDIKIGGR